MHITQVKHEKKCEIKNDKYVHSDKVIIFKWIFMSAEYL